MAIITISRGTFSGGKRLAMCLSINLGYRLISREVVVEAAARYGVSEEELARGLEQRPTLLDRFGIGRQLYLAAAGGALCRAVRDGDVVYHGNAGHLLLAGIDHVIRVRVIAPMPMRIGAAIADHGFDASEAEVYIRRKDAERVAWTKYLYGIDWHDPSHYDLVINLDKVNVEAACETIVCLAERPEYQLTEQGRASLDDLTLAYDIRVRLFQHSKIAAATTKLSITVTAGEVALAGVLPDESTRDAVVATVSAMAGVKAIHADWLAGRLAPV
jgi:cytidylate kinase